MRAHVMVLAVAILAWGCAKKEAEKAPAQKAPAEKPKPKAAAADHGDAAPLGDVTVGGYTFEIARLGPIAPGVDGAVTARAKSSPQGRDWLRANLYLWAEDADKKRLSAPSKAIVEKGRLHMHLSLRAGSTAPTTLVFRLREDGLDERVRMALRAGAATTGKAKEHAHEKTPHDGVVARLGSSAGWIELKLHDDKGDLELWVTRDKAGKEPFDLPLATRPNVTFIDREGRQVTLAPRNTVKNEDEDGKPTLRDGKTNYFIFPGETGADAAWLKGKTFESIVTVCVPTEAGALTADEFVLQPHTH